MRLWEKNREASIPVKRLEPDELLEGDQVCFLGHNTVWLRVGGQTFIFDPILGPISGLMRRTIPAPISAEELPSPDLILVSHAHRDHLDRPTLKRIARGSALVLPLKAGRYLRGNGFVELDWLSETRVKEARVMALPLQHWSQRGLFDHNTSLWTGYLVEVGGLRVFFGGDTGYFPGFKEIGEEFGPFDLAFLPCGAYKPRRLLAPFHMSPEEAVQAGIELKARLLIPIHWGAYFLGDEPFEDPPQRFEKEARNRRVSARVLYPGEILRL